MDPSPSGTLVVLAGAGYVINAIASVLEVDVTARAFTVIGEVLLAVRMVARWIAHERAGVAHRRRWRSDRTLEM